MRTCILLLLLAGCSESPPQAFEVYALEGRGIAADDAVIIPDARVRIPAVLKSCGIDEIQTVDATDGVVIFQFSVAPDGREHRCAKSKLPTGTDWL